MKTVNINIRIEEELREEFRKIAERNAQVPSLLIRKWIEDYVNENKRRSDRYEIRNEETEH